MKKRRGEENGRGNEELIELRTPAATRAEGSGDEAANAAGGEMEEIRGAVAEAIQKMEMETIHREIRGEGGGGREETTS